MVHSETCMKQDRQACSGSLVRQTRPQLTAKAIMSLFFFLCNNMSSQRWISSLTHLKNKQTTYKMRGKKRKEKKLALCLMRHLAEAAVCAHRESRAEGSPAPVCPPPNLTTILTLTVYYCRLSNKICYTWHYWSPYTFVQAHMQYSLI